MKTVTVENKQLSIADGGKTTLLTMKGQQLHVADDAVVVVTDDDAFMASSSWIVKGVEE